MNITGFMEDFIYSFYSIFVDCFAILDSISFRGTTLLEYIIAVVIIGTILPILLTLVRGHVVGNKRDYKKARKYHERSSSNDD